MMPFSMHPALLSILLLALGTPGMTADTAPTAVATATTPTSSSLTDVFAGTTYPSTLKLKEMTAGWSTFSTDSPNGLLELLMMGMSQSNTNSPLPTSSVSALYTRGETVVLGGETFLVAYGRSDSRVLQMMADRNESEVIKLLKITPETEVTLHLLNIRTMGNFVDIRPFDPQQILSMNSAIDHEQVKAQQTRSMSQLRQLAVATQMYIQDNNNKLPPMDSTAHFQGAILPYLGNNEEMFKQPGADVPYQVNIALHGKKAADINNPIDTVVVLEANPWPDGKRGVAFLDGHVQFVTEAEWAKIKANVKTD